MGLCIPPACQPGTEPYHSPAHQREFITSATVVAMRVCSLLDGCQVRPAGSTIRQQDALAIVRDEPSIRVRVERAVVRRDHQGDLWDTLISVAFPGRNTRTVSAQASQLETSTGILKFANRIRARINAPLLTLPELLSQQAP